MSNHSYSSSSPCTTAREAAFQSLQTEITTDEKTVEALLRRITTLKSQQNQLSPIYSLPDEILAEVFMYLVHDNPRSDHNGLAWITEATHACSRWRQVALQCPRLWSRPSFASPELAAEMIKRAKAIPLSFVIDLDAISNDDGRLLSVLDNLPLANSLIINKITSAWSLLRLLDALSFQQSAGYRRLFFESVTILGRHHGNVPHFPPHLFCHLGGSNSHLRRIHLQSWNLFQGATPNNLSWISAITHLEISLYLEDGTQQSSVQWVISSLTALPYLKSLTLRSIFLPLGYHTNPLDPVSHDGQLPILDSLVLGDWPILCHEFLTQLGCLPKKRLWIDCRYGDNHSSEDYNILISTIKRMLVNPIRSLNLRSNSLDESPAPTIHFQALPITVRIDNRGYPRQNITILPPLSTHTSDFSFLQNTCNLLPLENLELLGHSLYSSDPSIRKTFGRLKNVKMVVVFLEDWDFVRMLADTSEETGGVPFPALEYLRFENFNFDESKPSQVNTNTQNYPNPPHYPWSTLLQVLRRRFEQTNMAMSLCFSNCSGVNTADLKGFRGISKID